MIRQKKTIVSRIFLIGLVAVLLSGTVAFLGIGYIGFPRQPHFPVGKNDREVRVLGSNIRYREIMGKNPPVVLIHGNNLSIETWEPVMAAMPGRHIVAYDLIGYAGSDRRRNLPYDVECQRQYFISFLDAVGIDKAIIVGHSMGGAVAAWIAAKSSARVLGVVMISPPGVPGSLVYAWPKNLLCNPGILNRVAFYMTNTKLFEWMFPLSLARQTLGVTNSYNQRFSEALYQINEPALLMMAPDDKRVLFKYSKVFQERIKNLEFDPLPDIARHMAPRTYPEGTAQLINSFIKKIDESGKGKADFQ